MKQCLGFMAFHVDPENNISNPMWAGLRDSHAPWKVWTDENITLIKVAYHNHNSHYSHFTFLRRTSPTFMTIHPNKINKSQPPSPTLPHLLWKVASPQPLVTPHRPVGPVVLRCQGDVSALRRPRPRTPTSWRAPAARLDGGGRGSGGSGTGWTIGCPGSGTNAASVYICICIFGNDIYIYIIMHIYNYINVCVQIMVIYIYSMFWICF